MFRVGIQVRGLSGVKSKVLEMNVRVMGVEVGLLRLRLRFKKLSFLRLNVQVNWVMVKVLRVSLRLLR